MRTWAHGGENTKYKARAKESPCVAGKRDGGENIVLYCHRNQLPVLGGQMEHGAVEWPHSEWLGKLPKAGEVRLTCEERVGGE